MSTSDPKEPATSRAGQDAGATLSIGACSVEAERGEPELTRGTSLGRYMVLDRVGQGGMGVVYTAYDPELDRKVAIKLVRAAASHSTSASERQARLLREAQAMARLSHPNVIAVYDVGTYGDQVFIAMELVEGTTLKAWLTQAKRSWREVVEVFRAAGMGLAAAHAAGLVHRDFKPSNVLVGKDGRVRVMDFGVARPLHAPAPGDEGPSDSPAPIPVLDQPMTRVGTVVGTPRYMAPEQREAKPIDPRTDQYSFCVSLYESLFGEAALSDVSSGSSSPLEPPERDLPTASRPPRWVRRALLRGLREKPEERYDSMETLLAQLGKDPAQGRRRILVGTAALALVAFGVLGYQRAARQHALLCKGAEHKLAGVWDEGRKKVIAAAFVATRVSYAADTWQRAAKVLDDYTAAWASMHTDACEATRVRGEQSEELLTLRMTCLQGRLEGIKALTSLFAQADAQVVERAVRAAHALSDLRECADSAALTASVKAPKDEATRAQVEQTRAQLARAKALQDAGKYEPGLEVAAAALAAATGLGYRPLEAEAWLRLAALRDRRGDYEEALVAYKEAAWAAAAGHSDKLAAEATTWLLHLLGTDLRRFDEADEWHRHAMAVLERSLPNEEGEARLANALGGALLARNRPKEAVEQFQRAASLLERLYGPEHAYFAIAVGNVGVTLGFLGRHEEAIASLQRSLAINEKLFGPEHPDTAGASASLADAYGNLGQSGKSLELSQRALRTFEKTLPPSHDTVLMVRGNVGEALLDMDRPREAREQYQRVLALCRDEQTSTKARALAGVGECLRMEGKPAEALRYYEQAIALDTKVLGPDHPKLAALRAGQGEVYLDQGQLVRARALLQSALDVAEARLPHPTLLAKIRFALGRALWSTGGGRERAIRLVEQARDAYAKSADDHRDRLDATERWLAKHRT